MIEIVIPCSEKLSNSIKLLSLGFVDIPWSPNWTDVLNSNNKVLVYDIVADVTLDDSKILVNVGHTSIKLNDFKFLFKVNGFHTNVKLYYNDAIITELIKHSLPLNVFMMIYEDLKTYNLLDSLVGDDIIDLSRYINKLLEEEQGLLKFTKRFIDLLKNDNRIDVIENLTDNTEDVIKKHSKLFHYMKKQSNNTKIASHNVLNKLVDLLQLNTDVYNSLKGKPIAAGPASFTPVLPNVTRSQLFSISGETHEESIEGYSSGVLLYSCNCPITLSFLIYREDDKMIITKGNDPFKFNLTGSKDIKLYNDIVMDNSAHTDLLRKLNEQEVFIKSDLNLDLLVKACKALMSNDLIYYFAITRCYIDLVEEPNSIPITIVPFDKSVQEALGTYDLIGLSLGGYRDE